MLRSVCFKNFVHFKEKQFLDFQGAGPFIFIGENGAGKSSVLEGIRRCLQTELSTSVSSSFENDTLSYFICIFETDPIKKENDADSLNKKNETDSLKDENNAGPLKKKNETYPLKEENDADPLNKKNETDPLKEENDADPLNKKNETDPLKEENDAGPLKKKNETDPLKDENHAGPLNKKNETDPLKNENDAGPFNKKNETDPLKDENNAGPLKKKNETDPLKEENDADPLNKKNETDPLKEENDAEPLNKKNETDPLKEENDADPLNKKNETDPNPSKKEYVICGVVVIPNSLEDMNLRKNRTYYKFAMYYPERNEPMQKHLLRVNTDMRRIHVHAVKTLDLKENVGSKQKFIKAIFENTPDIDECVESFLLSELNPAWLKISIKENEKEDGPLDLLTNRIVFTFPLRSIGPLQWSESERIRHDKREENYAEAERRCEIIKSFLKDRKQTRFDRTRERQIFKALTKSDAYIFELSDDSSDNESRLLLNGEMFALLKAPEGILEAKAFSILMSGKDYKTIILEEPCRGMHPQFIERMVHLIKQYESEKRVILTTHNTAFISPWSLSDCFVFRRNHKECCIVSGKTIAMDTEKPKKERIFMKKLRLLTSDHLSDILFAKKVLFCEGDSDFLFITELKQQILSGDAKTICIFKGDIFDYMKLEDSLVELTIVKLNGKGNTGSCQSVSKEIKLDAIFLLDKEAEGRKEKFENEKNVFIWKYGDIEDMVIEMCRSNDKLKSDLSDQNVTVNPDKFQKTKKTNEKLFLRKDVSIENIRTGVKLILEQCKPESDLVSFIRFLYLGKA